MSTTTTHTLTFEAPTTRDGYWLTDLIAQCSCGAYEYVYSRTEGAKWHGLHLERPQAHPHFLLVDAYV